MANLANFCNSEKSVKLFRIWWTRGDSNPRPPRCERGALPAEILAQEQQSNFSKRTERCQPAIFACVDDKVPVWPKTTWRTMSGSTVAGWSLRFAARRFSERSDTAPGPVE